MRRFGLRCIVLAAAAAVLSPASASAGGLSSADVTATVSDEVIAYGSAIEVTGTLSTSGPLAPSPGGRTVRLFVAGWPYETEREVAATVTAPDGSYRFGDVEVSYNSRLRVVTTDGIEVSSPLRSVYVEPNGKLSDDQLAGGRLRVTWRLRFAGDLPYRSAGRRAFFYFRKTTQRRYRPSARSRTKALPGGGVSAQGTFELPRSRRAYRYEVAVCFEFPGGLDAGGKRTDVGIGVPVDQSCPRGPFRRF